MTESASVVAELGTIMGIWAHPDDEAYLSGGLMALARDAGSRVVCVTATCSAPRRTTELRDCLDILGVSEHHWLGYRDGSCAGVPAEDAVTRLCALLDEVRPDTVVGF